MATLRPRPFSSARASTAMFQRLSGLKRPILKTSSRPGKAARSRATCSGSASRIRSPGMPLGMTSGLTPLSHMTCFM